MQDIHRLKGPHENNAALVIKEELILDHFLSWFFFFF